MARDRFDRNVDHSDVTKLIAVRRVEVMTEVDERLAAYAGWSKKASRNSMLP